ncbi:cell division protein FtsN [Vibrio sp. SM6]|uniref:Cell division protein FtsN n=1 Tax=Vibrio agarilyticus TaxID=2726741 RepID=A0A7X8TRX6_9VIBR|nr:cell division protein FtsN [Vibrio agarilyticus]
MANRDYVRRGKGAAKPSSARSAKSKTSTKNTPRRKHWRSLVAAIVLVGGFGSFLYWLNSSPAPQTPEVVTQPTAPSKPAKTETLPPPPEEKWEYPKTLPEREIVVEAKELEVSKIPYILQCGAFKRPGDAEARKLDIAFQGLASQIILPSEGSGWYRVVLGPYATKRAAESDQRKLQRVDIQPCAIWKEAL